MMSFMNPLFHMLVPGLLSMQNAQILEIYLKLQMGFGGSITITIQYSYTQNNTRKTQAKQLTKLQKQ
jgi:hypothetical protein